METDVAKQSGKDKKLPRVNFRVLLFSALFLSFGIFLSFRIRFGGIAPSDFLFVAVFLFLAAPPFTKRRLMALTVIAVACAGTGALGAHLSALRYSGLAEAGRYAVTGTVESFAAANGQTEVTVCDLRLDGAPYGGKLRLTFAGESLRAGDILSFEGTITPLDVTALSSDGYLATLFGNDVRYQGSASEYRVTGRSKNPFLLLNGAIYDCLHENMERDAADVCYALLLGNTAGMDRGLLTAIRYGGIAHVFAVSGLHIGILYGAARLAFRRIRKWRELPAVALALFYTALCGFTPSSLRALVMCAAISLSGFFGQKADYLSVVGAAAFLLLLFRPAQWLLVGFRLSFAACLGLALFSGGISRLLFFLPKFLRNYFSACLSVLLFTFPIQIEAFGYLSLWGLLLNFFLIPVLPACFLGLILFTAFSLVIPPAAAVLAVPEGLVRLFLFLFSAVDFSCVLTGFSLGAGSAVYYVACLVASERVRFKALPRAVVSCALALLFFLLVLFENAVFVGAKIISDTEYGVPIVCVQTTEGSILIFGDGTSLSECNRFLARRVWANPIAAIVLGEDELKAINVAAFTGAERIYAYREIETGLREREVIFGGEFSVGGVDFRYESGEKLSVYLESLHVEIDFSGNEALSADLFLDGGRGDLIFYLKNGIIT